MSKKNNNYNIGGVKISIKDKVGAEEVITRLAQYLLHLEDALNIDELGSVNLYCQIFKDDKRQVILSKNDNEIVSGYSIQSSGKHKSIEKNENGDRILNYSHGIDMTRFAKTVEETEFKSNIYTLPVESYEEELEKIRQSEYRLYLEKKAIQDKIREQEYIKEQQRKEKMRATKLDLLSQVGSDDPRDFNKYFTSFGEIKTPNGLERYIPLERQPENFPVYRASRRGDDGKADYHYFYNSEFELFFETPTEE